MPRIKNTASSDQPKTKKTIKKSTGKATARAAAHSAAPKRKIKPVIVDVIEDEPLATLRTAFDESTSVRTPSFIEEEYIDSEEEGEKDLDQQKKFFSELVSEIKAKRGEDGEDGSNDSGAPLKLSGSNKGKSGKITKQERNNRPSIGLYRRFVIKFVILLGILALTVLFFCFSKLTISITPSGETLNDNLLLKVDTAATGQTAAAATSTDAGLKNEADNISESDPRTAVSGESKEITAAVEKTFPSSGEEFVGEDITGRVRVINNSNKDQALVATTRLLSPDNKLYRLKEAINIPAGGEVSVDIYADKPSEEMAIGATNFTIPGLWVGLQDKIYARNDTAFTFDKKVKKYVKSSDIETAVKEINSLLIAKAKEEAGSSLDPKLNWLYNTSDPADVVVEASAGEEKDNFLVKATGKIVAVSFDKEEAAKLAQAKINLLIPDNKELIDFNKENIVYSLEEYNSSSTSATIKASFSGTMVLKSDAQVVDRTQLVNLTKDQIGTYLRSRPEIKEYSLKFFPSFIQRAPRLVDRIKVVIAD